MGLASLVRIDSLVRSKKLGNFSLGKFLVWSFLVAP